MVDSKTKAATAARVATDAGLKTEIALTKSWSAGCINLIYRLIGS